MNAFRLRCAAFLVVAVFALLLPSPAWAIWGTIAGQVTDADSGLPIPGAKVELIGHDEDFTDANGYWSFTGDFELFGSYTAEASKSGYVTNSESGGFDGGLSLDLQLHPVALIGDLGGTIFDASVDPQLPIEGALVELFIWNAARSDFDYVADTLSNGAGAYAFAPGTMVSRGLYDTVVKKDGYLELWNRFYGGWDGTPLIWNGFLTSGTRVFYGTVTDGSDGSPEPHNFVNLYEYISPGNYELVAGVACTTDKAGHYTLSVPSDPPPVEGGHYYCCMVTRDQVDYYGPVVKWVGAPIECNWELLGSPVPTTLSFSLPSTSGYASAKVYGYLKDDAQNQDPIPGSLCWGRDLRARDECPEGCAAQGAPDEIDLLGDALSLQGLLREGRHRAIPLDLEREQGEDPRLQEVVRR
jgi:hypothetical protein